MQNLKSLAFATLASCTCAQLSYAEPAYTTPVGYVTETIKGNNTYNLLGVVLHTPVTVSGSVTSISSTFIGDSNVSDYSTALTSGSKYLLKITSGAQTGATQIISSWGSGAGLSSNQIATPENLSQYGVVVGDKYELRKLPTLSSLFGATNQAGFKAGTLGTADIIWLPIGNGGFEKFYYTNGSAFPPVTAGWKNASGAAAGDQYIDTTCAILIQRRDPTDLTITVSGEIDKKSTQVFAQSGYFNYVATIFPAGTTLALSNLQNTLKRGNLGDADILWMQKSDKSGYEKFYYTNGSAFPPVSAGWKNDAGQDASSKTLTSGMIIQRRGTGDIAPLIIPPSSISSL